MVHGQEKMDVYRLRPTAVTIKGQTHIIDAGEKLLTINQNRDRYRTIQAEEFFRCHQYGTQTYVCPLSNIVYKNKEDCLYSLYHGDDEGALNNCRLHEFDDTLKVTQHTPSGFYIHAPQTLNLIIKCGDGQHVERQTGLV